MKLGVIVFFGFLAALVLRPYLQRTAVLSVPDAEQPKRQFFMDLALCLLAAGLVMALNRMLLAVPIINGYAVLIGGLILGFFLAIDTTLARERANITNAISQPGMLPPPKRLYSMTRKFSLVAFTTAIIVTAVVIMVFARDIVWLARIDQDAASLARAQWSVAKDSFEILMGEGLVLGVEADYEYREYHFRGWSPGSVLVVGTDGIQETRNAKDELFGLDRLKETMAQHSAASALAIQTAVIDRLNQFRGKTDQEDDVTLVVVKLL